MSHRIDYHFACKSFIPILQFLWTQINGKVRYHFHFCTDKRITQSTLVYDTFGEAGLVARRAVGQRYSSPEEVGTPIDVRVVPYLFKKLRAELERLVAEARGTSRTWKPIISLGEFILGFDMAELFAPGHELRWKGPFSRLSGVKQTLLRVQHTMGVLVFHHFAASID